MRRISRREAGSWKYWANGKRPTANGFFPVLILLGLALACSPSEKKDSSPKFTQYYNHGEQLYQKHCSNCHQKNGAGLGRIYPPLDTSDYMSKNFEAVVCLIRYGKQGTLIVNGVEFNQAMPAIPSLTDLEIAEISTYIYNTWSHNRGIVEVRDVSKLLEACPPPEE